MVDIIEKISQTLSIKRDKVEATVNLLDDGNTIPFIARYRKERTGNLDEVQIRSIQTSLDYIRKLETRKEEIIDAIDKQGKLTPELKQNIEKCYILQEVEDLYLPFKQKRKTKASKAIEAGLEPLANLIMLTNNPEKAASTFINAEKGINSIEDAMNGAMDIVTERINTNPQMRKSIREQTMKNGLIKVKGKDLEKESEFKMYEDYEERISSIKPHRVLAINRGENKEKLTVKIEFQDDIIMDNLYSYWINSKNKNEYLEKSITEAYKKHIKPAIEREIRTHLTEIAEEQAIIVFSENLKNLIMQKPLRGKIIMGIDPGIRTGSKISIIDTKGDLMHYETFYQEQKEKSIDKIAKLCEIYKVEIIAIGNGTASREVEALISETISAKKLQTKYAIVSEAGASVYSASDIAREEFPDLDVSIRGAVSIARRVLDPLSEFVKIDPKSIGVGQYQHDVNQNRLQDELYKVVESCVNKVGVNINTASFSILQYVSGIGQNLAKKIVEHRKNNGIFTSRKELMKVSGFGPKTFEQSACFLKIPESKNFLDNTWVHPENYDIAITIHEQMKATEKLDTKILAQELNIGIITINDIIEAIKKPNIDPRDDLSMPLLRSDILDINDIQIGMTLEGTVRNVVDFGVFIDIGLKNDALCHISEISNTYIKNPREIVEVGDIVSVKVIGIDLDRKRISLSMKK